ncbi:hypothetical protein DENSPDRAFT_856223 [Dentipellis sp. KUC8613]|nr:hypothetical protein DENSPDRAFT_856223 [Dentipellis sp. KUC8613]
MADAYIDRRAAANSYRPKSYVMSPGLKRAREPYRVKNAITGVIVASFAVGAWAYSISAVKQDSFEDVDAEARALAGSGGRSLEDEEREKSQAAVSTSAALTPVQPVPAAPATDGSQGAAVGRGVLASVLERQYPRLLDPTRKTLVWGAPSVDRIGRIGDETVYSARR